MMTKKFNSPLTHSNTSSSYMYTCYPLALVSFA